MLHNTKAGTEISQQLTRHSHLHRLVVLATPCTIPESIESSNESSAAAAQTTSLATWVTGTDLARQNPSKHLLSHNERWQSSNGVPQLLHVSLVWTSEVLVRTRINLIALCSLQRFALPPRVIGKACCCLVLVARLHSILWGRPCI